MRQIGEDLLERVDDVACDEARDECAQKARTARRGECAAHEADGESRPVRDAHGDEACEHGQHEAEGDAADVHEGLGVPEIRAEVAGVGGVEGVKEEGEGDQDAAADDERQHVRDAVHQMLVDLARDALVICRALFGLSCAASMVVDRRCAGERLVQERVRLVDAVRDLRLNDGLAVKTRHLHVLVRRDDDACGFGDLRRRQDVFRAARAVRLHLDGDAALLRVLLQAFRRHEGVGDARRARRDGEDLLGDCRRSRSAFDRCGCLCAGFCCGGRRLCRSLEFAVLLRVDEREELVLRLRRDQSFLEVGIHDHRREFAQDFEMNIGRCIGCGDLEEEARGLLVHRLEIHACGHRHRCKPRRLDAHALGVRRRDAIAESRRARRFSCEHVLFVLRLVREIAALFHQPRQDGDGVILVLWLCAERDALALQ